MSYTLEELAKKIGATVVYTNDKEEHCIINSLATLKSAKVGQVAFLANNKYQQQLELTRASAVIISKDCIDNCPCHALVMDNPYLGYALTAQLLDTTPKTSYNIHPSAVLHADVKLGENVSIGANSVLEAGIELADGVSIGAGCFIGENVHIGKNSSLWSNISIYHGVKIGQDCLIQANTVIGSDGFGYANEKGQWLKIPQLGSVIIGNKVEIGASTTVDRGALENTIIKDGVILDNQVQIAHNAVIGENTAIAGCSVIAGSTTIGKNCTIAGMVAISGHLTIADGCVFTGRAMVIKSITEAGVYSSGMPVLSNKEWRKANVHIRNLNTMSKRIRSLEKK